ncbi:ROK family protein [Fimbriiglobus ruber]|uniref:Glucokinase n=1 Tax=Fimbriiglobus ruber TaxID=1908690 RepID=A0A225E5S9_9BACT|nr:ROK family protein [Fimbriiglobus ruber]OWK45466.1 Glucokinase [Fimbriiglobus ruber]
MAAALKFVGLDVGGTTMKAAVVDDYGLAGPSVSLPTEAHRGADVGLETMCETIRRAVAASRLTMTDVAGIGVATPGLMDIKLGIILDPPNLKPWRNVEIPQHIRKVFHKPVAFQNDANAAALGEHWVGAGKGAPSLVLFTLGTGVGGGIIVDGRVLEGEHSHGGELGHLRIDLPDRGRLCGCGRRGCLEAYASATAVVDRAREDQAGYRGPTRLREMLAADDVSGVSAKDVFDVAAQGDLLAQKVVEDTAYYLALGACAVMATVDPEMIVFGGGMTAAGDSFLAKIREYALRFGLAYPASKVQIRFAQLGSDAGFIGAAACARQLVKQG